MAAGPNYQWTAVSSLQDAGREASVAAMLNGGRRTVGFGFGSNADGTRGGGYLPNSALEYGYAGGGFGNKVFEAVRDPRTGQILGSNEYVDTYQKGFMGSLIEAMVIGGVGAAAGGVIGWAGAGGGATTAAASGTTTAAASGTTAATGTTTAAVGQTAAKVVGEQLINKAVGAVAAAVLSGGAGGAGGAAGGQVMASPIYYDTSAPAAGDGQALDFGATLAKLFGDNTASVNGKALDTVDSAVGALAKGNAAALASVNEAQAGAFDFGETLAKLFGANINAGAGRALDSVDAAQAGAYAFGTKVSGQAFDLAGNAQAGAFDFGTKVSGQAFDLAGNAQAGAFDFGATLAKLFGSQVNTGNAQALDFASSSQAGALSFAKVASGQAFDFGGQALASVDAAGARADRLGTQALDFAGNSQAGAFDLVGTLARIFAGSSTDAASRAFDSADVAAAAAGRSTLAALESSQASQAGAFDLVGTLARIFAGNSTDAASRAFDSADLAAGAAGRSTLAALDFAGNSQAAALSSVDGAIGRSLSATTAAQAGALDYADGVTRQALDFVKGALAQVADSSGKASDLVATAYNDAKGRGAMTDTLMLVAIGGAVLVALFALKR